MAKRIYKVLPEDLWAESRRLGVLVGSPIDQQDGFIHFSAAEQLAETLAKHFVGQQDLILLTVEPDLLGDELKWEPSRAGDLFPHFYGQMPLEMIVGVDKLRLDEDQIHVLPAL